MAELVDRYLLPIPLSELADRLQAAGELQGIVGGELQGIVGGELQGIVGGELPADPPSHLSYDSRDVTPGTLFFCKGANFKPEYLQDALAKGAVAYVAEEGMGLSTSLAPGLIVNDARRAMALAASWYYADIFKDLSVIGITGTKGKSTTAYFIKSILDTWMKSLGQPETAILSSIDNYDGIIFEESHLTTKESLDLYRHFANAVASGISYLTMEVSSQGLKYHRVTGIPFTFGGFLNFGRDHISSIEHTDAEDYLSAKLKIFEQSEVGGINLDSDEIERIFAAAKSADWLISFGWHRAADLMAYKHEDKGAAGCVFKASVFGQDASFELGLAGRFNVENALAAIAATTAVGAPYEAVREGLRIARVPGRMEPFEVADGKLVLVDYAHNLMSFEALFEAVRGSYPDSHIAVVFGCPGYKALDRRHDLGMVSGREADDVVLTEEDAGDEPVEQICEEIAQHVREAGGRPRIILDREEAIVSAIEEAPPGAVILVTGKGRETRQKRGKEYVEVASDVEIVESYIARQSGGES